MAGNGPAPKPDEQRRRRNAPTFAWTILPVEGRKGPAPKLPRTTPEGRAWLKATREWWADLWSKPQATQWDPQSAELLARVMIYERMLRGEVTASELSEARQIDDRHGLSPKALLALRWKIGDAEDGSEAPPAPRAARQRSSARRRAAMTVIAGGG